MFNFNRTLQNLGLRRRPQHSYGRMGGGMALPLIAALAYRYREPIMKFVRERFGKNANAPMQRGYTNPASEPLA